MATRKPLNYGARCTTNSHTPPCTGLIDAVNVAIDAPRLDITPGATVDVGTFDVPRIERTPGVIIVDAGRSIGSATTINFVTANIPDGYIVQIDRIDGVTTPPDGTVNITTTALGGVVDITGATVSTLSTRTSAKFVYDKPLSRWVRILTNSI